MSVYTTFVVCAIYLLKACGSSRKVLAAFISGVFACVYSNCADLQFVHGSFVFFRFVEFCFMDFSWQCSVRFFTPRIMRMTKVFRLHVLGPHQVQSLLLGTMSSDLIGWLATILLVICGVFANLWIFWTPLISILFKWSDIIRRCLRLQ